MTHVRQRSVFSDGIFEVLTLVRIGQTHIIGTLCKVVHTHDITRS